MKKLLFTLAVSTLLFSCEKEVVNDPLTNTTTTTTTLSGECDCGIIDFINQDLSGTSYAIIYNSCSMNDTTVNYIPQTNAGSDKSVGDPHCLGISW